MSFFDDDPPTQQRRSAGPPTGGVRMQKEPREPRTPRGGADQQQIMTRRLTAIVGLVILLLLVGFVLKSCADTARTNGLKTYNTKVNDLGSQSISNVTEALQVLTSKDSADALGQRQKLDELAGDSSKLTDEARKLDTPGSLKGATQNLATALSLRSTALSRLADLIGKARGTSKAEQESATQQIAGQMEALLASDVLWQMRVTPFIKDEFASDDIPGDSISSSTVIKDLGWLNTATVATRIGGFSEATDTTSQAAPGTHGHGLASVAANGTALASGQVATVNTGSGLSFTVTIENQGENDETDVVVAVSGTKRGGGAKFDQTKTIPLSKKGTKTSVEIPITKAVTGSYNVTVEVRKVLGEKNTSNNKQTYSVIFG